MAGNLFAKKAPVETKTAKKDDKISVVVPGADFSKKLKTFKEKKAQMNNLKSEIADIQGEILAVGILRVFSIALFIAYALLFKGCCDYGDRKRVECVVLDKITSEGKSSSSFYLILQETTGAKRSFDLYVSPLDYSQSKKGEVYYMKMREMDIEQTPMKNLLYFFLPIIRMLNYFFFFLDSSFFFI